MTQWFRQRAGERGFSGRATRRRSRPFRPALEALEDRMVLSTLTVTNLNDSGAGSLRGQIAAAASGDSIAFANALNGTITLSSGELVIDKNLSIFGPGATTITVSGGGTQRVFHTLKNTTVSISGLTIANGKVTGFGGGIESEGALTLSSSTV